MQKQIFQVFFFYNSVSHIYENVQNLHEWYTVALIPQKKSYLGTKVLFLVKFDKVVTNPCSYGTVLRNLFKVLYNKRGKEIHAS